MHEMDLEFNKWTLMVWKMSVQYFVDVISAVSYFLSKHFSLIRILKAEISETRLSLALKGRKARVFGQI